MRGQNVALGMILCLSGGSRLFPGLPQLCRTSRLRVSSWLPNLVLSLRSDPQSLSLRTSPRFVAYELPLGCKVLFGSDLCGEFSLFAPLYILVSFVKNKVLISAWVYFWAFYLVPLVCISVFVPVPYCLDDFGFVV